MPRMATLTSTRALMLSPHDIHVAILRATRIIVRRGRKLYVVYHSKQYFGSKIGIFLEKNYLCGALLYKYMYMTTVKMISTLTMAAAALLIACGNGSATNSNDNTAETPTTEQNIVAKEYDFRIVAQHAHSTESYTQGLEYVDGVMWEGTGREGKSHIQRIDLTSGKCNIVASLPKSDFGEGITHFGDRIYQLTWLSEKAYVYDLKGSLIKTIPYRGEGWGITTDGTRLFMSDGSSVIRIVNPETFDTEGVIGVTINNSSLELINELEWIEGKIWANVYLSDCIVEIDPATGKVTGFVDLSPLRELLKNNPEAEAMNGIAYNPETKNLYVTGKDWNRLFEIEIYK